MFGTKLNSVAWLLKLVTEWLLNGCAATNVKLYHLESVKHEKEENIKCQT